VILHKDLVTSPSLDLWLDVRTTLPDYEDEYIAVFNTQTEALPSTRAPQLLEGCVGVRPLLPGLLSVFQGEIPEIPLEWIAGSSPEQNYILELQATLVSQEGEPEETLSADLMDIEVLERPRSAYPPAVNATFGSDLRLHGYNLETKDNIVDILLYWQSLRPMEVDYKFFVHLYDMESEALVAQEDVMPHNWAYPTTSWDVKEVVSDRITLSLEGVPPGTYTLGVGVYNPFTGERLPITDQPPYLIADGGSLVLPEDVIRQTPGE
jgi:hypothetical protein